MLFYYKLTGLNAVISIVVNLLILLGMMAYLGATMTLPGIAGFILTIGIGVDSNVLIFERIKEELAAGEAGARRGQRRLRPRVVDDRRHARLVAHRGRCSCSSSAPARSAASRRTLIIGLASNVFTAVFVSRTMFELVLGDASTRGVSI